MTHFTLLQWGMQLAYSKLHQQSGHFCRWHNDYQQKEKLRWMYLTNSPPSWYKTQDCFIVGNSAKTETHAQLLPKLLHPLGIPLLGYIRHQAINSIQQSRHNLGGRPLETRQSNFKYPPIKINRWACQETSEASEMLSNFRWIHFHLFSTHVFWKVMKSFLLSLALSKQKYSQNIFCCGKAVQLWEDGQIFNDQQLN